MTKEDILDILNQARDYADRSIQACRDAQELISEAETQSLEACHSVEKAIDMIEEYENE
jgi:vacuolar-type H+-ATPase subunit H|tara:strand:- start:429 stop:605 length:177 start_codon:yes stop_codon:yes gene_type:complete